MTRSAPLLQIVGASAGLIAWAAQFSVIYAATSVVCARGYGSVSAFGFPLVPVVILAATAAALLVTALSFARAWRRRDAVEDETDRFFTTTTILVSGFSLVAILWHGLPALIVPSCG